MIKIFKFLATLFFLIIGLSTTFFILINLVVFYLPAESNQKSNNNLFNKIIGPESTIGYQNLKLAFHSGVETALERFRLAPSFSMHPDLHFITSPTNNKFYHIGENGLRYEPGWNNEKATNVLNQIGGTYLFGGSTMFGHGVASDETISYFINDSPVKKTNNLTFNFGAQAYDFQRAAEKLVYLLRIGYRPKTVVFLIGWNELVGSARSNMRWQDKVIYHGFSVNRGEVAYTPDASNINYLSLFSQSLPLVQYMQGRKDCPKDIAIARNPWMQGFDFFEANCVFKNWEQFAAKNQQALIDEQILSLKSQVNFVEDLSRGFGFKTFIIYQPIGLFDPTNSFVPEEAKKTLGYSYLLNSYQSIKSQIKNNDLNIIDGSSWLNNMNSIRYIDVAHYSPEANKVLADQISSLINTKNMK